MGALVPARTSDGRIVYFEPKDNDVRSSIDPEDDRKLPPRPPDPEDEDDRKMPSRPLDPEDDPCTTGPDPPLDQTVRYRIDRGTNNQISARSDTAIMTRPLTQGQRNRISRQMTAIQGTSVSVIQGSHSIHASQVHHQTYIYHTCLLYTSPSPRDLSTSRMPSSA